MALEISPLELSLPQAVLVEELSPVEIDCAIAVMLKILDGKCKMPPHEAQIMAGLYDLLRPRPAQHLGAPEHEMIAIARAEDGPRFRAEVYEARVLAETRISRPVMKGFKAKLRKGGILPAKAA